jgi:hypothetical protein
MPEAIIFHHHGQAHTVYFARPKAVLPVLMANGDVKLVTWGRRQNETSEMPLGGWARLPSVHDGKWSLYTPKPVHLTIAKFMQSDFEGRTHWYEVTRGQYIQGLLANLENEYRVYVVTIIPELLDICHDRWPRIIVHK